MLTRNPVSLVLALHLSIIMTRIESRKLVSFALLGGLAYVAYSSRLESNPAARFVKRRILAGLPFPLNLPPVRDQARKLISQRGSHAA